MQRDGRRLEEGIGKPWTGGCERSSRQKKGRVKRPLVLEAVPLLDGVIQPGEQEAVERFLEGRDHLARRGIDHLIDGRDGLLEGEASAMRRYG